MFKAFNFRMMAIMLVAPWGFAVAHHGTGGFYDEHVKVKVEGVVKEFHWRNPHSGLFVITKDAQGKDITYALEMGSPNSLARVGFNRRTFSPGDKVTVEFFPSHVNPSAGELISSNVWVNGKRVSTAVASANEAKE